MALVRAVLTTVRLRCLAPDGAEFAVPGDLAGLFSALLRLGFRDGQLSGMLQVRSCFQHDRGHALRGGPFMTAVPEVPRRFSAGIV